MDSLSASKNVCEASITGKSTPVKGRVRLRLGVRFYVLSHLQGHFRIVYLPFATPCLQLLPPPIIPLLTRTLSFAHRHSGQGYGFGLGLGLWVRANVGVTVMG